MILSNLEQHKLEESLQLLLGDHRRVNAARHRRALGDCHRQERERQWEQRERFHRQMDAVRSRSGL